MSRLSLIAGLFLLAPIVAAGCAADTIDPGAEGKSVSAESAERGPIGKADLYGQCMEIDIKYCGGKSSGNCYCDSICEVFGDCCSDYVDECLDEGPSCDDSLMCGMAITCVDGQWYPTTCGPANCDEPMGACGEPEETICGGFLGTPCADDEFCSFDEEAICGFADASGVCKKKSDACTEIYEPVCGCNGKTYSNTCSANADGASVKFSGDCECGPGSTQQYCWGQSQCVPLGAQC